MLSCLVAQIPVYIWAPEEEGQFQPGRCSRWWLHQSLKSLDKDLKVLGTNMVYRRAPESRTALVQLVQETGAQARFCHCSLMAFFLVKIGSGHVVLLTTAFQV